MRTAFLSTLALLGSLSIAGCALEPDFGPQGDRYDERVKFVGLWVGIDKDQNDCQVEVIGYEEYVDDKIPGDEQVLASQELTKTRRSMQLKLSLQASDETVFEAMSQFDPNGTAYVSQRLEAAHMIDEANSEKLVIILDGEDALQAVTYELDTPNRCHELQLMGAPGEASEEEPAEPQPYPRGAPRR